MCALYLTSILSVLVCVCMRASAKLCRKLLENLESTCYTPKQFAQVFLDTVRKNDTPTTNNNTAVLLFIYHVCLCAFCMQDFNLYAAYCKNYSDGNFCLDKILSATEDTELRKEIEVNEQTN